MANDQWITCWSNWTETSALLLQTALQRCMVDPLAHWGTSSWMVDMQRKVQAILDEDDKEQSEILYDGACFAFAEYQEIEATSILEMALWKGQLERGWSNGGNKQHALDREESQCVCGSHVAIPQFLEVPLTPIDLARFQ
jgi:hypothetical protein